jgi:hypothetical protein
MVLLAALAAALPAGLRLAARVRDLSVTVRSAEPHEIAARPEARLAPAVAGPPELVPRLELSGQPDRDDPGLWLRTWQVTYGRRWERQVTVPVLVGPFDPEGKPWPCAVAVRLSPQFFADEKAGGKEIAAVLDRLVRAQFPFAVLGLRFAAVRHTSIAVRLDEGALSVTGNVVLGDSASDPTRFFFSSKIRLGERDGDLVAKVDRVRLEWSGSTRRDPLVELASIFVDVDAQARQVLAQHLGGALSVLKLPRDPISVLAHRPNDRVLLRLCDAPEVHPDGLTVRLRVAATLAEPRLDPSVPGPPHLEARPELGPPPRPQPLFEAAVSAAGVEQALYVIWQAGELSAWGRREQVVAALRNKLQDRLAFELGAVDPRLPPVVLRGDDAGHDGGPPHTPGAFRVRFGDLALGTVGGRTVLAHGDVLARGRVDDASLGLAAELADLRVSCAEGKPGEWRLSPCFSDVVPVLRESGLTGAGLPLDLPIPDRLLRVDLVLGTELSLHGLEGEVSGSPPQLRIRGEARLAKR